MRSWQPPARKFHGYHPVYVPASFASSDFVYVRRDSHKHPLQRPYDRPYRVLNKNDKYFTVEVKGRSETITINRLKAAFVTQLTTCKDNTPAPGNHPWQLHQALGLKLSLLLLQLSPPVTFLVPVQLPALAESRVAPLDSTDNRTITLIAPTVGLYPAGRGVM
ncbi:Gag-Pol polyprotein [Elysia marginata]|uniref:Gag-Pol polyprotein n=1 Tax=Elysia marginata TaxID=1093978 RepID=A0AAV4F5X1_9GAST|nr:Gag-Pol polyprotein [Elysia marginata]